MIGGCGIYTWRKDQKNIPRALHVAFICMMGTVALAIYQQARPANRLLIRRLIRVHHAATNPLQQKPSAARVAVTPPARADAYWTDAPRQIAGRRARCRTQIGGRIAVGDPHSAVACRRARRSRSVMHQQLRGRPRRSSPKDSDPLLAPSPSCRRGAVRWCQCMADVCRWSMHRCQ